MKKPSAVPRPRPLPPAPPLTADGVLRALAADRDDLVVGWAAALLGDGEAVHGPAGGEPDPSNGDKLEREDG